MELINGTDIVVMFKSAGVATSTAIFCSTSCTLNINQDTVSATCKDGGNWANNLPGNKSWDVSVDGLYQTGDSASFIDLTDLLVSETTLTNPVNSCTLVVGQIAESGEVSWTGEAVLTSASLTAPDGEIATWSASFTGNGELLKAVVT